MDRKINQSFLDKQKDGELEEIYKLNSIPYNKYDSLGSQLKIFLDFILLNLILIIIQNLSIINTSDALREGYRFKINDMTINKTNYKIKKEALINFEKN